LQVCNQPHRYRGSYSVTRHPAEVTFLPSSQPKVVLDLATPEGCTAELTVVQTRRQVATNPQTKPTDLNCESAAAAVYTYHRRLLLGRIAGAACCYRRLSVCLSVLVTLVTCPAKRLNRSRCRLGVDLRSKESCFRRGLISSPR